MSAEHVIDVDLAEVWNSPTKGEYISTIAWGEVVEVSDITSKHVEVVVTRHITQADGSVKAQSVPGFIRARGGIGAASIVRESKDSRVFKVDFVDVQQGDATVVESPGGDVMIVDGGDNQMLARYLANRFRGTSDANPKDIACIVVTHGDADHFAGLSEIHKSESNSKPAKRLFIRPHRVYHNGLVKGPSSSGGKRVPDEKLLGATTQDQGTLYVTGLHTDLINVSATLMNTPFREWQKALRAFEKRKKIAFARLDHTTQGAFSFFKGVQIEVLGPLVSDVNGVPGLRFLGDPPPGARRGEEATSLSTKAFKGKSASHTINGHSIVLRLTCGNVHILLSGDLNDQSERVITQQHKEGRINLRSEVFKVPHHGSHDFSAAFMAAVSPVVSVVSSGDESVRKEYVHPRATLLGALGRNSRVEEPLIFITELVAFFSMEGYVCPEFHQLDEQGKAVIKNGKAEVLAKKRAEFFAFRRAAYGITMVRTDGERLLVYTNSGQAKMKEAYAFTVDTAGLATPSAIRKV